VIERRSLRGSLLSIFGELLWRTSLTPLRSVQVKAAAYGRYTGPLSRAELEKLFFGVEVGGGVPPHDTLLADTENCNCPPTVSLLSASRHFRDCLSPEIKTVYRQCWMTVSTRPCTSRGVTPPIPILSTRASTGRTSPDTALGLCRKCCCCGRPQGVECPGQRPLSDGCR
jgi:hypothetical protein